MKRKWKAFLFSTLGLFGAGIIGLSCFLAFRNKPILPLDVYLLKFSSQNDSDDINASKNKYINEMINKTRSILDGYSKYYSEQYGEKFTGLNFDYVNLNASQSEGERNYFLLLNRTLKAIDERLSFNNISRSPVTVQEGFYQKNTEMLSFYWSPDFNSVTTWLSYMFGDEFSIPNQWPSLYNKLMTSNEHWCQSLKQWLASRDFMLSPIEVINKFLSTTKASADGGVTKFYTDLANSIGVWIEKNSEINLINHDPDHPENDKVDNSGDGILMMNWLSSQIVTLPFVEDGMNSSPPYLIRRGYFNPNNPNTDYNFRDWYYNDSASNGRGLFRFWLAAHPFDVNKTPLNPSFSNAPSSMFFSSAWTALTSWTTTSDYNHIRDTNTPVKPTATFLVSTGITNKMSEYDSLYDDTTNTMTFKIRPIPWVDINGQQVRDDANNLAFLSPQDFNASIISFIRSIQIKMSSNDYFIDLISMDVDKTIHDAKNNLRNTSSNDEKEFVIHFTKKPEISIHSVLDILQKQYFCAVPAFKESVKNIIDYQRFKTIINASETNVPDKYISNEKQLIFNSSNIDYTKFYGSGNPVINANTWRDCVFAAPYYISHIDEQQIIFNLNQKYFDAFTQDELNQDAYASFRNNQLIKASSTNGNNEDNLIKKINQVVLKYSGSYSDILTYEQFKSNELDYSSLSSAKLLEAKKLFPNDYRVQPIDKLNKSNLIGFNLQVFSKNADHVILDDNEKPMLHRVNNKNELSYTTDQWGNYDFGGQKPKLKSNISRPYYDLIVRDYYTPLDAYDPSNNVYAASATIRETIVNCINWIGLKSVVFPGVSKSIQYSFLPYGVYQIGDEIDNKKYWWYAAYKPYMTDDELNSVLDEKSYYLRKSGMMIWTYNEMLNNVIKKEGN